MTLDMTKYKMCPQCHTYQSCLEPCRKCGWHSVIEKQIHNKGLSFTIPLLKTKPNIAGLRRQLALLRELSDGDQHRMCDLHHRDLLDKWKPCDYAWQAELMIRGVVEIDKDPDGFLCICTRPDMMQDAEELMTELEAKICQRRT